MRSFLVFFDLFVALPEGEGFCGCGGFVVAENPSVATADFVIDAIDRALDVEFAFFFGDLGDHNDLKKEVAEFFFEVFVVGVVNGLLDFFGFFVEVFDH